ncbi:MAG: LamG domain protein jellyroll fold domain protein [Acidobacteriaceae bacterium]|nr:LamG domain protein jellyroll fold domain protein [Acidobacteriaceae bacterium]
MDCRVLARVFPFAVSVLFVSTAGFATTPVITVSSPANNSQVDSPVNYVASAKSPQCSKGIAAMRIYTAPNVSAYTRNAGQLNTYLTLQNGTYNTVVQAWDNCGGVVKANVKITVVGRANIGGFIYITNSNYFFGNTVNEVNGYAVLASNGALAPTGQGPVKANVFPLSVASDKGGYRLYVGDYISGDVFAYFINRSNGYLTAVPGSPFPVNHSVTAVAVHPSGKLVFATRDENAAGDGVAVFQVQNNGSLKATPGSPYSTQNGPQALVVDANG